MLIYLRNYLYSFFSLINDSSFSNYCLIPLCSLNLGDYSFCFFGYVVFQFIVAGFVEFSDLFYNLFFVVGCLYISTRTNVCVADVLVRQIDIRQSYLIYQRQRYMTSHTRLDGWENMSYSLWRHRKDCLENKTILCTPFVFYLIRSSKSPHTHAENKIRILHKNILTISLLDNALTSVIKILPLDRRTYCDNSL